MKRGTAASRHSAAPEQSWASLGASPRFVEAVESRRLRRPSLHVFHHGSLGTVQNHFLVRWSTDK